MRRESILTIIIAVFVITAAGSVGFYPSIDGDDHDRREWVVVPPDDYNDPR